MRELLSLGIILLTFLLVTPTIFAANEVVLDTDRLNFWDSKNHTVYITYTGVVTVDKWGTTIAPSGPATVTAVLPSTFNFAATDSCGTTPPGGVTADCNSTTRTATFTNVSNSTTGTVVSFIVTNTSSFYEYELSDGVYANATNGTTTWVAPINISFIKIKEDEVFHTLVEYGRGRGNYFYDSMGSATSGRMGTGYPYVPNETNFELNYLHKILNIKQYYGLPTSIATLASWTCDYTNNTVVRQHLVTAIQRNTSDNSRWYASYAIDEIEGSWERMGYIGQDFDTADTQWFSTSQPNGTQIPVKCRNIVYRLADAAGNVTVDTANFNLSLQDPDALNISASSSTAEIGNGTTEVEVTYTITNNAVYPVWEVILELKAPTYGTFIGTRGELWGTSLDKYIIERVEISPGGTETITLVVRYDTFTAGPMVTTDLWTTTEVSYVQPWEVNAYNPAEYIQTITAPATGMGVDMLLSAEIVRIQDILIDINITINNNAGNLTTILTKIRQLREFDDELIFLVTDSFDLREEARDQAARGDDAAALESLREANEKLREAADRLKEMQIELQDGETTPPADTSEPAATPESTNWLLIIVLGVVVLGCIVSYFYFTKKK